MTSTTETGGFSRQTDHNNSSTKRGPNGTEIGLFWNGGGPSVQINEIDGLDNKVPEILVIPLPITYKKVPFL